MFLCFLILLSEEQTKKKKIKNTELFSTEQLGGFKKWGVHGRFLCLSLQKDNRWQTEPGPSKFFPPDTSSTLEVMYDSSISRTDLQQLLSSGPAVRASHASSVTHLVTDSEPVNQKLVSVTAIIQRLSNRCAYS